MASSRFLHALLTVGLLAMSQAAQAQWSAANDEANRQRMMASMRAQDAANDRAAADRAFQAGLEQQRSLGSGSSPSSSSSGSAASAKLATTPERLPSSSQGVSSP